MNYSDDNFKYGLEDYDRMMIMSHKMTVYDQLNHLNRMVQVVDFEIFNMFVCNLFWDTRTCTVRVGCARAWCACTRVATNFEVMISTFL